MAKKRKARRASARTQQPNQAKPQATVGAEPLLAPTLLFRFESPCHYKKFSWSSDGVQLPKSCMLPSFGELEGRPVFADVRAAWCDDGMAFNVRVVGKKQSPWCRITRVEDSDGFQVWLDTRNTHTVHRARRFCHRFCFLPMGEGRKLEDPIADLLPIHRALEMPKPIESSLLKVRSEQRIDGYVLEAFVPGEAMTGFDMSEHSKLGFTYAVVDRELGWQTYSVGPEFPFVEDPSLWGTLDCVKD